MNPNVRLSKILGTCLYTRGWETLVKLHFKGGEEEKTSSQGLSTSQGCCLWKESTWRDIFGKSERQPPLDQRVKAACCKWVGASPVKPEEAWSGQNVHRHISPCSTTGESGSFWPQTPNYQKKKKGGNVSKSQWPSLSLVTILLVCISNLPTMLHTGYYFPDFIDEETEAQRSWNHRLQIPQLGCRSCVGLARSLAAPSSPPRVQSLTSASVIIRGFPGGSDGKESACNARDLCSLPGLGRSRREGNGNPLQYSCLENPRDREIWRATVHGVIESWTRLSD